MTPERGTAPTRRQVLQAGAVVFATVAVSGCALFLKTTEPDIRVMASGDAAHVPVSAAPWVRSGDGTLVVAVDGWDEKVLVFRTPEGELAAVATKCPHKGCDVRYARDKGHLVCPCHGSEFANDGSLLEGPAKQPLARFGVRVDGEDIVLTRG